MMADLKMYPKNYYFRSMKNTNPLYDHDAICLLSKTSLAQKASNIVTDIKMKDFPLSRRVIPLFRPTPLSGILTKLSFWVLAMLFANGAISQTQNAWEIFEKTKFKNTFVKEYGTFIPWPDFTPDVLAWQGKEVLIAGYIIPTAEAGGFEGVIISKFPYAMCFFCGEAGIESVAELRLKSKPQNFKMDKTYVFKGKLLLNDKDFEQLNFILTDVELTGL